MEKGTYFVGDLCYVLTQENGFDFGAILNKTRYLNSDSGVHEYQGTTFFSTRTMYGDGCFVDNYGHFYHSTGTIGCFPLSAFNDSVTLSTDLGQVINFEKDFDCAICDSDGIINIGHIKIRTQFDLYPGEETDLDSEDEFIVTIVSAVFTPPYLLFE